MYEPSKIAPLKYIEYFLQKDSFESYEKRFFDYPINPSFKSNREEGYVYYLKDFYANNEVSYVKHYFKEELEKTLALHIKIALSLLHERKDEIENTEKNADLYINRQLNNLEKIKQKINYFKTYQPIMFKALAGLEDHIKNLLEDEPYKITKNFSLKISGRTFFDLKKEVKTRHLKKLYEVTVLLNIIDDDLVTEEEFLKVLTSPILPVNNCKIIFNKNNRISVYYLSVITSVFNDFKPSTISRSLSFVKKGGEVLNDNQINNINSYLKKNDVSKYNYIKEDIENILPK